MSGAVGAGTLFALVHYGSEKRVAHAKSKSYGEGHEKGKWDSNWDQMAPKPPVDGETPPPKPTATRHLILVRHGQYEMNHSESDKKVLTEIGRQQAVATGKRLRELNRPYTVILHSTLIRAIQTAALVSESLPDVPLKSTDMLKEGPPVPPEPPVSHWNPPYWVRRVGGPRVI